MLVILNSLTPTWLCIRVVFASAWFSPWSCKMINDYAMNLKIWCITIRDLVCIWSSGIHSCWLFLGSLPRNVSPWHNTRNACVTPEVANDFTISGRWSMQHFTRSIPGIVFSTGNKKWINLTNWVVEWWSKGLGLGGEVFLVFGFWLSYPKYTWELTPFLLWLIGEKGVAKHFPRQLLCRPTIICNLPNNTLKRTPNVQQRPIMLCCWCSSSATRSPQGQT